MKYLVTMTLATTTFAIALLIGGFDSTLVYAGESDEENCMAITDWDEHYVCWERNQTDTAKIDGIEPVGQFAKGDEDGHHDCLWSVNEDGLRICSKADENGGEGVAGIEVPDGVEFSLVAPTGWGNENSEPVKTASGTFYPLPMVTVAEMDKLLAPGGTSVASFDRILAPGGTAVESEHQFADREDGSGGDFGESGGGDFGEADRAAASTAAE